MNLLPEWYPQKSILFAFPPKKSDWKHNYKQICKFYKKLLNLISQYQHISVLYSDKKSLSFIPENKNILTIRVKLNDTWIRDYGPICVKKNKKIIFLDFTFNGWGSKFTSNLDNKATKKLSKHPFFKQYKYKKQKMILEGGSIEYNGDKVLLTTKKCLLNPNRNANLSQKQIEKKLKKYFGVKKILWLKHGFLQGDDTDSHIDTLARFCNKNTICYTKCTNKNDPHYQELKKMRQELKSFTDKNNKPFKLISLPLPKAVFDTKDNHRLPATYANFLILKKHILLPTYNDKKNDNLAKRKLKKIFKDKKIIKINSLSLIKQHGSLHCASMQIPKIKS